MSKSKKSPITKIYEKIKSNRISYIIFIAFIIWIIWHFLGVFGISALIAYKVQKMPIVRKHLAKFADKEVAKVMVVALAIIVFGGIFGFAELIKSLIASGMASYVPQPPAVTAVVVKEKDWHPIINTIGEAQAIQSTGISSQSGGIVTDIDFKSGEDVKKGDLLFKLDTSSLEAQLAAAEANLTLAKITNARYKKLAAQKATSKESADKANADYLSALADVNNIKSQIAFKEIRAPFDGRIGIRNINLGQYFESGGNAATLTTLAPIFIDFSISQNKVNLLNLGEKITFFSDTFPGETFTATITAINSYINSSNRSIMVQAVYQNEDHKILPGMFVTVHVNLPVKKDSIIIPRNAINYNLYGESVYTLNTIKDKNGEPEKATYTSTADGGMKTVTTDDLLYKIGQDNIKVLETKDNFALVSGLKANTTIITSGQNKVRKGGTAIINNKVQLSNDIYNKDIK